MRIGDGYQGWPDAAPFDIILVTAAPEAVPTALVAQLRPGGRLVIPVGPVGGVQDLLLIEKDATGRTTTRSVIPVRFVPLRRCRQRRVGSGGLSPCYCVSSWRAIFASPILTNGAEPNFAKISTFASWK